jgi:prevent-host-death family protein
MTNVVSALTARTQFGQIMKRATQRNERFVVGRRGEPSVVIMSVQDYMKTFAPAPEELRAMQATAKRTGAARLTAGQVNRIVATVRRERKPQSAMLRSK